MLKGGTVQRHVDSHMGKTYRKVKKTEHKMKKERDNLHFPPSSQLMAPKKEDRIYRDRVKVGDPRGLQGEAQGGTDWQMLRAAQLEPDFRPGVHRVAGEDAQ